MYTLSKNARYVIGVLSSVLVIFILLHFLLVFTQNNVEDFSVLSNNLRFSIRQGSTLSRNLEIKNNLNKTINLVIDTNLDQLNISKTLTIGPKTTVSLKVSYDGNNRGVYVGYIKLFDGSQEKIIPVSVEVESYNLMGDLAFDPITTKDIYLPGELVTLNVKLFRFGNAISNNTKITYYISDLFGHNYTLGQDDVTLTLAASSYSTRIIIPFLPYGQYYLYATMVVGNDQSFSTTSKLIYIKSIPDIIYENFREFLLEGYFINYVAIFFIVLVLSFALLNLQSIKKTLIKRKLFGKYIKNYKKILNEKLKELDREIKEAESKYDQLIKQTHNYYKSRLASLEKKLDDLNKEKPTNEFEENKLIKLKEETKNKIKTLKEEYRNKIERLEEERVEKINNLKKKRLIIEEYWQDKIDSVSDYIVSNIERVWVVEALMKEEDPNKIGDLLKEIEKGDISEIVDEEVEDMEEELAKMSKFNKGLKKGKQPKSFVESFTEKISKYKPPEVKLSKPPEELKKDLDNLQEELKSKLSEINKKINSIAGEQVKNLSSYKLEAEKRLENYDKRIRNLEYELDKKIEELNEEKPEAVKDKEKEIILSLFRRYKIPTGKFKDLNEALKLFTKYYKDLFEGRTVIVEGYTHYLDQIREGLEESVEEKMQDLDDKENELEIELKHADDGMKQVIREELKRVRKEKRQLRDTLLRELKADISFVNKELKDVKKEVDSEYNNLIEEEKKRCEEEIKEIKERKSKFEEEYREKIGKLSELLKERERIKREYTQKIEEIQEVLNKKQEKNNKVKKKGQKKVKNVEKKGKRKKSKKKEVLEDLEETIKKYKM